jgi:quercetin dioxygenase-like cupin family protein
MSLHCLEVRRSARARVAAATMRILLVSAVSLLVTIGASSAADPGIINGTHDGDSATIISELPQDHPVGTKATVTLISLKRALHPDEPFLSTFIVDYLPGGSAVLHRSSSAGYVLVHVLSGTIRAQAWDAGMGTYRSGQTWVEPAVANQITTKNASAVEPARALVVLITNETTSLQPKDY